MNQTEKRQPMMAKWLPALAMAGAVLLGGCAAMASDPALIGQDQAAVVQVRGYPAAVYAVDGQNYWFYDVGREKSDRDLLIFDANGLLVTQRPAWTKAAFEKDSLLNASSMDVLHRVGPPLAQGVENRHSLLGLGRDEDTPVEAAQTFWRYGFRASNQFYNAYVIFSDEGVVSDIYIQRDVVGSRNNSF